MSKPDLAWKVQLFRDTVAFKPTERTPHLSDIYTWKVHDSDLGYSLKDTIYDLKLMEKVFYENHERYQFDAYTDIGNRNPMKLADSFGEGSSYIFDENSNAINVIDKVLMEGTEYEDYAADMSKFKKELFRRKYPHASAETMGAAIQNLMDFGQYIDRVEKKLNKTYGTPIVFPMMSAQLMPIEEFVGYFRGIKNVAIDMRRYRKPMKKALDTCWKELTWPRIQKTLTEDTSNYPCDCYTALLAHTIMSPKQFEEFYWPYLKQYIDAVAKAGKTIYIYCEGSMKILVPFLKDYPKGLIALHPEYETVEEVRELLPNVCVVGGMTCQLLNNGTPEECVAEAKRLIDTMGPGFILAQDKMVSFPNDCKRENLLAVCDFVRNYKH